MGLEHDVHRGQLDDSLDRRRWCRRLCDRYLTILIPLSTWLLMGYFKSIPFELEEIR